MVIKILLTPFLILTCLLVARRWGSFVGGVVAGLPLISGPVSFFLTLEQGPAFSAQASSCTLLGVLASTVTALVYPWLAVWGLPWFAALPISLLGFFGTGWAVLQISFTQPVALFLALAMPALILLCLPRTTNRHREHHAADSRWRVPVQMAGGVALVCAVTGSAHWLGPGWSGLFMFFPVLVCSIVPFVHATQGVDAVVRTFRGIMAGWVGCIAFVAVVMAGVEHTSLWVCYGGATAAALISCALVSVLEQRMGKVSPNTVQ